MPWSKKSGSARDADAWSVFNELEGRDPSRLTTAERNLVALCYLRQEVNSDGFSGYFFYDYGDSAPVALEALPSVLGQAWADLFQEAMDLFGTPYPTDCGARQKALSDEAGDLNARLHALDERFYDLEAATDADAALDILVRSRAES